MSTTARRAAPLLVAVLLAACQGGASPPSSAAPSMQPSVTTPTPEASEPASTAPSASPNPTHWEAAGTMVAVHERLRAVAFEDGRVLAVGDDQQAELWDPTTNEWATVPSLNKPRTNFALVRLHDGRALVIGGVNDRDQSYLSAFAFDPDEPDAGWIMADGLLGTARTDPGAAVLSDGRVLVVGGYFREAPYIGGIVLAGNRLTDVAPPNVGTAMATAELFDPSTGRFTSTGPMRYARHEPAVTTLADGRVLVIGSRCTDEVTVARDACTSAEIYNPATGQFTLTTSLPAGDPTPFWMGTALPLDDGGALLMGRYCSRKYEGSTLRSFRFDAEPETWHPISTYEYRVNPMAEPPPTPYETPDVVPQLGAFVGQLLDGRVVVAGGDRLRGELATTTFAQVYDPADDSWTELPSLPEARVFGAAVTLPDGSLLLVGGHQSPGTIPGQATILGSAVRLVP